MWAGRRAETAEDAGQDRQGDQADQSGDDRRATADERLRGRQADERQRDPEDAGGGDGDGDGDGETVRGLRTFTLTTQDAGETISPCAGVLSSFGPST